MVSIRIDPRLASRVDPSDVVQDTLTVASQRLSEYARKRPLPFYPWLRRIAQQRLLDLQQEHIKTRKRSVLREDRPDFGISDQSVWQLASKFIVDDTSPSARLVRKELHQRARNALDQLSSHDREVLVMRHLEQMAINEIAADLDLSESAVKMRCLRAIQRLRELLVAETEGDV
jgi:RNA polymerase sigma-70 factor (ECF subfamily)